MRVLFCFTLREGSVTVLFCFIERSELIVCFEWKQCAVSERRKGDVVIVLWDEERKKSE